MIITLLYRIIFRLTAPWYWTHGPHALNMIASAVSGSEMTLIGGWITWSYEARYCQRIDRTHAELPSLCYLFRLRSNKKEQSPSIKHHTLACVFTGRTILALTYVFLQINLLTLVLTSLFYAYKNINIYKWPVKYIFTHQHQISYDINYSPCLLSHACKLKSNICDCNVYYRWLSQFYRGN